MERPVKVACAQVEPVVLDREATLDKLETVAAEAAREGAELVVFPETFVPVYPSSLWAKAFAGWDGTGAKETFARLAQESVAVGSPAERRIGAAAKELGIWIVTGVNEVEPERPGTIYNSLLYHSPAGELALHHRKLVPTNHERLVWGQGDGRGLEAVEAGFGRVGGLICWRNRPISYNLARCDSQMLTGASGCATPIMESRVTSAASSSSLSASVPSGRRGITRYRMSAVESCTCTSTLSSRSRPNSCRTPRGSDTARDR